MRIKSLANGTEPVSFKEHCLANLRSAATAADPNVPLSVARYRYWHDEAKKHGWL